MDAAASFFVLPSFWFFTFFSHFAHNFTTEFSKIEHKVLLLFFPRDGCETSRCGEECPYSRLGRMISERGTKKMKSANVWRKKACTGLVAAAAVMLMGAAPASAAELEGVDMSTAYPGIMMKAGDTVTFDLDFLSLDGQAYEVALSTETIPEDWIGYFKGKSNTISKVHVGAGEEDGEDLADYSLTVPADAQDGVYQVKLKADAGAGKTDVLELEISVTAEEYGESNFTSEYPEQQGASGTTFTFDTTIVNNRAEAQSYSLSADAPIGWQVTFTSDSTSVTSVPIEAGASADVKVTVTPTETVAQGEYSIPVSAVSASDSMDMDLAVSITGTYDVQLTTDDGLLSCDAYANEDTAVTLVVTNNGNVDLTDVALTSSAPTDWEVTFSEDTIETLAAGESKQITAYIKPCENSITGDYVTYVTAATDETTETVQFRVTVKTSTTWGFAAFGIIILIVIVLGIIFKKYGRR